MRFHTLCHSCATLLAAQRVPTPVAMDIRMAQEIRPTLGMYTHVPDQSKCQAADIMEPLFGTVSRPVRDHKRLLHILAYSVLTSA